MSSDDRFPQTPLPASVLDRYLAGEATPDECAQVERWRQTSPVHNGITDALRAAPWTPRATVSDVELEWQRIRAHTSRSAATELAPSRVRNRVARVSWFQNVIGTERFRTMGALATIAVALFAFASYAIVARSSRHGTSSAATEQRYVTARGQRSTVTLADGSQAMLAPATTLQVTRTSSQTIVTVYGKALFTVAHSSRQPFLVRAGRSATRVLGTTFLVRQYATDSVARIVVVEGRVAVTGGADANQAVLSANASATVNDSGQVLVTPHVTVDDDIAWTRGVLVFRDTPARDVLMELGRTYGIELQLRDSVRSAQRLTWSVDVANQSFSETLDVLATLLDVHVVRTDNILRLEPGYVSGSPSIRLRHPLSREPQYGR